MPDLVEPPASNAAEIRCAHRLRWRAVRRPFETVLAWTVILALAPLPRRAVRTLAAGLGALAYRIGGSLRRVAEANLDVVFGETRTRDEKRRILRAAYRNIALTALDIVWFSVRPASRLARWVQVEPGVEPQGDTPRLYLTAHLGNWELLGHVAPRMNIPLHSVATPLKNPDVDRLLLRAREKTGQRIIPRNGAFRAMLAVLRRKEAVALLLDQNTGLEEGGEFHDFFGLPATVSPIAGLLGCRSGATVQFGFCLPRPDGTYLVRRPEGFAVTPPPASDRDRVMREVTGKILRVYEDQIRAHPECWVWMYKRWKHIRPGDDPARYPFYSLPPRLPRSNALVSSPTAPAAD